MIDCLRNGTASIYEISEEVEPTVFDIETKILQLMRQATSLSASIKIAGCRHDGDTMQHSYILSSNISQPLEGFYLQVSSFSIVLSSIYSYSVKPLTDLFSSPSWLNSILHSPGHPKHLHHHPNTHSAYLWNMFHATQLRVAVDQISHLELTAAQITNHLANINTLTDSICSSIHSVFTAKLLNKPTAQSSHDVCGVRAYAYLFPLSMTAWALRKTGKVVKRLQQEQLEWQYPEQDLANAATDVGYREFHAFQADKVASLLKELTERAGWTQLVLEQMQWDFGISGSVSYGDFGDT